MTPPRRTLFLHIGTRKSGTSYLQNSLRASVEPLRAQGLGTPFVGWRDHFRSLLVPVRDLDDPAAAKGSGAEVLEAAVSRCRSMGEPRLLASFEDLAELDADRIALLAEAFDEFDVQIILTARHWGSAMPSEWQQCIKERLTVTFADYVAEIRSGEGPDADRFLRRQDVAAMLERWGAAFGVDNVHLIPLPAKVVDRGLLPRLFCGLVGVDAESLVEPDMLINQSLGYDSAEVLRRVNLALGDRLPGFMNEYRIAVRSVLRGPLMKEKGSSPAVPTQDRAWCEQASVAVVDRIKASGWDVVGDLDDLVADDWSFASGAEAPDDAAVARIATSALADVTVTVMEQRKATRATKKPTGSPAGRGSVSMPRRLLTRLRTSPRRPGRVKSTLPDRSSYGYVFVVTYGRSGSTLVQGLVNSLPRTLMRGENNLYVYPLFEASVLATEFRDKHENHGIRKETSAFYGLGGIDEQAFAAAARDLVTSQLLGEEAGSSVDTIGFKEVLWHRVPAGQTAAFFEFMDRAFPDAKYVLNGRSHDDVVGSGFWQTGTEDDARAAISRVEEIQAFLRESRPERCFDTVYETLTGGEGPARDDMLRELATFVTGACDEALLQKLQATLTVGHGPNPFGASRGRDVGGQRDSSPGG